MPLLVQTNYPDAAGARAIAAALMTERLAAAVDIGAEAVSVYRWEGEIA